MSVEVSYNPEAPSVISSLEPIHELNFLKIRKRVEMIFDRCIETGDPPGPGRIYYTDRFCRAEATQRFQYGLFNDFIREIENYNFDFHEERDGNFLVRPKSEDEELLSLYDNFEYLFAHTEKMFDDCWRFFCSDTFPLNLYNEDMSVSSAFVTARDDLNRLNVGLRFVNDRILLSEVIPPTPENQRKSRIYDTNTDVVNSLSNLACFFSNDFFELYDKDELEATDLLRVYAIYKSMLEAFILIFSDKDVFGYKEVSKFDQINPFVFLETFLTLTKHVAELRANSLVGLYMIRSFVI